METIEDIIKELGMVTEKHPDQWIYDIGRVRRSGRCYDKISTVPISEIEHVTLEHLAIRINSASNNIRCCLKRIHKLSKTCMTTSDPYKLGKALYEIFKETEPLVNKQESEVKDEKTN